MSDSLVTAPVPETAGQQSLQAQAGLNARGRGKDFKRDNFAGYLFISPWLIGFFLFALIPIAISLWLAFTDYDLLSTWHFVGLDNFVRMFTKDIRYAHAVRATIAFVVISVPLRLIVALAIAVLMNAKRRGVYFYRAAFYAPSIVGSSVAVAVMWRQIFGGDGLMNALVSSVGFAPVNWLGNTQTALWTLVLLTVWQFGSPMLIFLAGLRQIPQELYEAAAIDGAAGWEQFWRISMPLLTPVIFFNLIVQLIAGFKVFTQAFIVTGGEPLDTTLFYSLYLYNRAFVNYQMGYAAAMAWVMLAVIAILTFISFKLSSYWVYYETK